MKKVEIYFIIFLLQITFSAQAQPVIIKAVEPANFPQITVKFFDRNPEEKKASNYALVENGKKIKLELNRLTDSKSSGKDILILFENSVWPEYAQSRKYFKQILQSVIPSSLKKGDRFFLATFDWTNKKDGRVLEILENSGTDNIDEFKKLIDNIEAPTFGGNSRNIHATELFQAMSEGIQFLSGKQSTNTPAILVLSAEFSNIYNDKYDDGEVINDSRKANIPIYAMRYKLMNEKYNFQKICNETYGYHTDADVNNSERGIQNLNEMLNSVTSRGNGVLYELEYQSNVEPDGSMHEAELLITGFDSTKFSFQSPGLMHWLKKYPWLWALVALVFSGCVFLVYFLIRRKSIQLDKSKKEVDAKMERIKQENKDALVQQNLEYLKEKQIKEEEAELNKFLTLENDDIKRRANRLKIFPRLPSLTNAQSTKFLINTPDFNIGRDAANCQLNIDDVTVSRIHACISFEKGPGLLPSQLEGRFFIWDNGSANGTFVNNKKIPTINDIGFIAVELSNGDVIKLGNIQLIFNF